MPPLLARIRELAPARRHVLIATMGVEDDPGGDRGGLARASTCTSATSAPGKNRRLVEEAGFVVDSAEVLVEPEDRDDARFLWVVAHAP